MRFAQSPPTPTSTSTPDIERSQHSPAMSQKGHVQQVMTPSHEDELVYVVELMGCLDEWVQGSTH